METSIAWISVFWFLQDIFFLFFIFLYYYFCFVLFHVDRQKHRPCWISAKSSKHWTHSHTAYHRFSLYYWRFNLSWILLLLHMMDLFNFYTNNLISNNRCPIHAKWVQVTMAKHIFRMRKTETAPRQGTYLWIFWISSCTQLTRGGAPAWGWGDRLTIQIPLLWDMMLCPWVNRSQTCEGKTESSSSSWVKISSTIEDENQSKECALWTQQFTALHIVMTWFSPMYWPSTSH